MIPKVAAVYPAAGASGTTITISGTEFSAGDTVVIGQGDNAGPGAIAASNVQVVSSTKITATTGGGAQPGTWNLNVISPDGAPAPTTPPTSTPNQ